MMLSMLTAILRLWTFREYAVKTPQLYSFRVGEVLTDSFVLERFGNGEFMYMIHVSKDKIVSHLIGDCEIDEQQIKRNGDVLCQALKSIRTEKKIVGRKWSFSNKICGRLCLNCQRLSTPKLQNYSGTEAKSDGC
tara:strand:+ start:220 stop:624 length:405 start_codon:yes stop_codon:yes gene_type:complete